jgi:mono/diheme cytochrome c family protein
MKNAMTAAAAASAFLFCASALGHAQGRGDPQRGHELSVRLCANCHAIARNDSGPVLGDVPGFPAIADRSGLTPEQIAGRIIIPHPAMPGVSLTAAEIRDIVSYITSLRRAN